MHIDFLRHCWVPVSNDTTIPQLVCIINENHWVWLNVDMTFVSNLYLNDQIRIVYRSQTQSDPKLTLIIPWIPNSQFLS